MLVSLLLSLLVLLLIPLILLCLVVAVVVATICVFFESHAVARTGGNEWKIHGRGSQPHACTRGRVAEKRATRMSAPRNHVVDLVAYKILDSLNMGASRNHMSPSTGRPPTLIFRVGGIGSFILARFRHQPSHALRSSENTLRSSDDHYFRLPIRIRRPHVAAYKNCALTNCTFH